MSAQSDFELDNQPAQAPGPKPTTQSITVSAKRKVETTRYGNAEVMCSITVTPDPEYTAADNLDVCWALLSNRIDDYVDEFVAETDPKKP